ncbi:AraC family transcriptional regulator [Pseudomonas pohangensis]|uniref:AraC family transcriptional regulator n=1 Tax=Pseudomonas pohangensis TaxID=364197 RepID=A0A1H2FQ04_9PSED|nr:AraC family transcriptional regulator [Pseudomonas pohangensis]SDU09420.1 AraC family transcriptional regulator [Pseudomonas pohangensis]
MDSWQNTRKELGSLPILEGSIGGEIPLQVERYLLNGVDRSVSGLDGIGLVTQFGGARVQEGEQGNWRSENLPSQSLLIPRNCPTHWHYNGVTDFAVFYFSTQPGLPIERFTSLTAKSTQPLQFSDTLVGSIALQLLNELQKGSAADERFMEKLADVMLEQTYRALTTPATTALLPRHVHFQRLQKVLPYIREHLAEDLSAQQLAGLAGVSIAHFRRLFHEALGVPVHSYVMAARLEQARKFLATTSQPISRIAEDCGFSSQSHFTACFRAAHAATPAQYRTQLR